MRVWSAPAEQLWPVRCWDGLTDTLLRLVFTGIDGGKWLGHTLLMLLLLLEAFKCLMHWLVQCKDDMRCGYVTHGQTQPFIVKIYI